MIRGGFLTFFSFIFSLKDFLLLFVSCSKGIREFTVLALLTFSVGKLFTVHFPGSFVPKRAFNIIDCLINDFKYIDLSLKIKELLSYLFFNSKRRSRIKYISCPVCYMVSLRMIDPPYPNELRQFFSKDTSHKT